MIKAVEHRAKAAAILIRVREARERRAVTKPDGIDLERRPIFGSL